MLCTSLSFGQEVVWKGIVRDSITKEVLSDVRICLDQDMKGVLLNSAGEFQISVEKGTKVWFRKQGYKWGNIVVTNNSEGIIELPPSSSSIPFFPSIHEGMIVECYINDVKITKEEWNDVRLKEDDKAGIRVRNESNVMRLYYTTK